MKHFVLLAAMTVFGALGAIESPFWGVLLYYTLAVLRPQYLWAWSLPGDFRWSLIAAGIVVVGTILALPRIALRGGLNRVCMFILAYALLLLFSCIMAFDPAQAQTWGIEYAKILFIGLLASMIIFHLWQVRLIAVMILVVLGYVAYEVNSLYFLDGRLDIYHYGVGGLDNNGAGLMLAMGVPFAYAFATCGDSFWRRGVAALLGLFMIHAVLMSYSRGAMLAATLGVVWLLSHHRPRRQALAITAALVLAVAVMAGPEIKARFLSTTRFTQDSSAQSRFESWDAAWQMAWDHPFFGQGIRNSNQYSYNYGADRVGRTIHSQYLQIAADSGIPAMTVYATLLGLSLWSFRKARQSCLDALAQRGGEPDPTLVQFAQISLAYQASLVAFAFGATFLSLEVFELPWLLIVVAGVMPAAVERYVNDTSTAPVERLRHEASTLKSQHRVRPALPAAAPPIPKPALYRGLA